MLKIPSAVMHCWPLGFGESLPTNHWQVLHALPRQDKKLMCDLRRRGLAGVAFYENRERTYKNGRQNFQVPLLGGYIFANISREQRTDAYDTGRLVRIIDVVDAYQLAQDLTALNKLLTAILDRPVIIIPQIVAGKTVLIKSGMFAGCSGVVLRCKSHLQLIVNLQVLGQSVATTIPLEVAELVTESIAS